MAALGTLEKGWWGLLAAVVKGSTTALGNAFATLVSGLTWCVQIAVFLVWFGPYIMGLMQLVMLSLFPFILGCLVLGNAPAGENTVNE